MNFDKEFDLTLATVFVIMLLLALLSIFGCESYVSEWELASKTHKNERIPMLQDGRIHIGMTQREFAELWDKPPEINIDRSTSRCGITEWWWFDYNCEPTCSGNGKYAFCFENGLLDYWSEN